VFLSGGHGEANTVQDEVPGDLSQHDGIHGEALNKKITPRVNKLLSKTKRAHTNEASLTTPGCNETVNRMVL
jgi:carbonic anhydrase